MHNCKANREALIALALNLPDRTQSLPAELETCATCREEYAALRNTLRITDQAEQSALPADNFWPGYHARLRQRLHYLLGHDSVEQSLFRIYRGPRAFTGFN